MILVIPTLFSISFQVTNNLPLDFINDLCFQRDQRHYKVSFPNCFQFFVCFHSRAIVFPFLFRLSPLWSILLRFCEGLNVRIGSFFLCFLLSFGLSRSLSFFCSEHLMDLDWNSFHIGYHWLSLAIIWPIGVNTFSIQHSVFIILHSAFCIQHSSFSIHHSASIR